MRVRELRFRGIGPYVDEHVIDFAQLRSGLYLINGPTGAGKTTIIDALVYGLYGRLSGAESDDSRLRSQFAGPGDRTEIDLVFETGHGVFRIIRNPAYMRTAKKGGGETEEKASVALFRVSADGGEEQISRLKGEADREIERVVGLTHAQFVQTIVLPQGQFATFLHSGTSDRAEVLKNIFNTALYEQVVRVLKEDAERARAEVDGADQAVRDALARVAELVDWDDETLGALRAVADLRQDEELLAALTEPAARLGAELELATTRSAQCLAATEAADRLRTQARLEAQAEADLHRAEGVLADAVQARTAAQAPVMDQAALAHTLGIALDHVQSAGWRASAQTAVAASATLKQALDAERAVAGWPAQRAARSAALENLRLERGVDETLQAELPARVAEQMSIESMRPDAATTAAVTARGAELAAAVALQDELAAQRLTMASAQAKTQAALIATDEAGTAAAHARAAWIAGQAAELAVDLRPGVPCPVCGAVEHPHPAVPGEQHTTRKQMEDLEAAALRARAGYEQARAGLDAATAALAQLESFVQFTPQQLGEALAAHAVAAQELAAAEAAALAASASLIELRAEQEAVSARLSASAVTLVQMETELAAAERLHAEQAALVAEARDSFASVQARMDAIDQLSAALGRLADAVDAEALARAACAEARTSLDAMPRHDGFADTDGADAQWAAASAAKDAAVLAAAQAQQRLDLMTQLGQRLRTACADRDARIVRSRDLLHVARLFNPQRGSEYGLHIHVLRSLFVDVIEAANRRLESLLGGRFQLELAPEGDGDRRSLQGLGLQVVDALSGKARPSKTLSGGETFCASLALSLGLADVVRANAGGIEIGTLFIDEGFGTLDPGVLDEVMVMLQNLGDTGRLVGVISHVAEMRNVITERIDVTRTTEDAPSSLTVSWMPDAISQ